MLITSAGDFAGVGKASAAPTLCIMVSDTNK